jgi:competence ComEA-like helix-hairpin-helix protein
VRASVPGLIALLCTAGGVVLLGTVQGPLPEPLVVPYAVEKLPETELARSGSLDMNRANAGALQALPGVGPATSAAIVADRERHGPFASVSDLQRVKGIGPAKLEAIRPFVYTSPAEKQPAVGGPSAAEGYARGLNE